MCICIYMCVYMYIHTVCVYIHTQCMCIHIRVYEYVCTHSMIEMLSVWTLVKHNPPHISERIYHIYLPTGQLLDRPLKIN